jgi:8-oxo-dGTP diphosphatase
VREATLCHPIANGEVLLIRKKRGPGAGNLVGPGGKVEAGETPREAMRREVREETGLRIRSATKRGELAFEFGGDPFMFVHVYVSRSFAGDPEETPEGTPGWYPLDDLPYEEMWDDDRYWLPVMLDGERFRGEFYFDAEGEALLDHDLETGVDLE